MSENWYCTGCGSTSYPWHHPFCTGPRPVVAVAPSGEPSDAELDAAMRALEKPWLTQRAAMRAALTAAFSLRAPSVPASPAGDEETR